MLAAVQFCVKHLNPRQGITTVHWVSGMFISVPHDTCETPKSPPGDYNLSDQRNSPSALIRECETPKSPPGDYNVAEACSYPVVEAELV